VGGGTPYILVSRTRKPQDVKWSNTRVISDLEELRKLNEQTGKTSTWLDGG